MTPSALAMAPRLSSEADPRRSIILTLDSPDSFAKRSSVHPLALRRRLMFSERPTMGPTVSQRYSRRQAESIAVFTDSRVGGLDTAPAMPKTPPLEELAPLVAKRIGRNVAALRERTGLTQEKFEERSGVNTKMIEAGRRGSLPTLFLIAKFCNVAMSQLFQGIGAEDYDSGGPSENKDVPAEPSRVAAEPREGYRLRGGRSSGRRKTL